jgi:hydroxymethylpyrimidine/phosphomethylpyrimidine kinase
VAIVAVTAQNTVGVQAFELLSANLVRRQIESVTADLGVDAAKTGMLASAELVTAVASAARDAAIPRLVVDPVFVSKHGDTLLADDAVEAMRDTLIPLATVVTPNLPEAARLVGRRLTTRGDMEAAGLELAALGPDVVLVKGGHLDDAAVSPDCLVGGGVVQWLEGARVPGRHTHGTGCVLSAAITAELARGMEPADACVAAKRFVTRAIGAGLALGGGVGPVNPGWERLV